MFFLVKFFNIILIFFIYLIGCWCREFIVFATFCNLNIEDMYPTKMTVDGGRRTLDGITSINNDLFFSDINTLPLSNVIITPPHIRTPKGRRPTKRFSKHDKKVIYNKKRKQKVERLISLRSLTHPPSLSSS